MVYNTLTSAWEEPDVTEKELLMGYRVGDTEASGVTCHVPWMVTQ